MAQNAGPPRALAAARSSNSRARRFLAAAQNEKSLGYHGEAAQQNNQTTIHNHQDSKIYLKISS